MDGWTRFKVKVEALKRFSTSCFRAVRCGSSRAAVENANNSQLEVRQSQATKKEQQDIRDRPARDWTHPIPVVKAGSTTHENGESGCRWSECSGSEFKVRAGPNYKKTGAKKTSGEPFYKQIAMDVFRNTYDAHTKVDHVAPHVRLPPATVSGFEASAEKRCALPRIVVCNCQVPTSGPKLFGSPVPDAGVSIVQYFEIQQSTVDELRASGGRGRGNKALELLVRFFAESMKNDDMRRRFKAIGIIENILEMGLPELIRVYNGKPVIIFKTGRLYSGTVDPLGQNVNDWYFEIDINVHSFNYIAKKAFCSFQSQTPRMKLKNAFVIQGESDEELDERVFACSRIEGLDLSKASPLQVRPIDAYYVQEFFKVQSGNKNEKRLSRSFSTV